MQIKIQVADASLKHHSVALCAMIEEAARLRGTGIAKRDPLYIEKKIAEGMAIMALQNDQPVGFCYIESWEDKKFVVNSGLIVHPDFRKTGLAKAIKERTFKLSKEKFPDAKLFGITTSMAVMKINAALGYQPVTFSELTQDEAFWKGCQSCTNYDVLTRTNRSMCLCTGMVCDLKKYKGPAEPKTAWDKFKQFLGERAIRLQNAARQFPVLSKRLEKTNQA